MMKRSITARASLLALAIPLLHGCAEPGKATGEGAEAAGNVAIVNGKAVPRSRVEVLLQQAVYCGIPAANSAFEAVREVVAAHAASVRRGRARGCSRHWPWPSSWSSSRT